MQDKLIPLCKLYENVSKTTGRRYFVGNLSFTSKVLVLENQDRKEGEPGWTVFLAEREPKPQTQAASGRPPPTRYLTLPSWANYYLRLGAQYPAALSPRLRFPQGAADPPWRGKSLRFWCNFHAQRGSRHSNNKAVL